MYRLIAMLFFLVSNVICASPFSLNNIVVFGDSLSDNGNLYTYMNNEIPTSPPYYSGRFSNGPIWVELLAEKAFPHQSKQHLLDYAYGGAAVATSVEDEESMFSLQHEIARYVEEHNGKADPKNIYFIWIGANNYLNPPEGTIEENVAVVNNSIKKTLAYLIEKGAKNIALINIPDLSRTPFGLAAENRSVLLEEVTLHNQQLADNVQDFKQQYPDVRWFYFDAFGEVNKIIDSPYEYGFNNVEIPCYALQVDKDPHKFWIQFARVEKNLETDNCTGALFFDPVHPTALAHQLIADHIWKELNTSGFRFKS